MISPCHRCWLGLFVGCGHVITGEKRDTHTCDHVLFKGRRKHSESNGRHGEQLVAREFRGGGQNGTQLLDAPCVRLRFTCLIIKILPRFLSKKKKILARCFSPLICSASPERIAKMENEVHEHRAKFFLFDVASDEVGGVLLLMFI
jgi:hypothetical protein